jgi:hypothetical protein
MLVVAGTVYLGGSGDPDKEAALWQAMAGGRSTILYWPFALPADMRAGNIEWLTGLVARAQPALEIVAWETFDGHSPDELFRFDALAVGGGHPYELLDRVRRHSFFEPVRDFVAAGGDYYGGSAGAVVACPDTSLVLERCGNDVGLANLSGFGLVDIAVYPHFDEGRLQEVRTWAGRLGAVVLGIPETCGVIARDGTLKAVGPDVVWWIEDDATSSLEKAISAI